MNADDEKKLLELLKHFSDGLLSGLEMASGAYAIGRRAGMTEAAGICKIEASGCGGIAEGPICSERGKAIHQAMAAGAENCAAAIEKARDAK